RDRTINIMHCAMRSAPAFLGALAASLLAGCAPATAATGETAEAFGAAVVLAGGQDQPAALVVDDSYVYFAISGDAVAHGSIRRVSKFGGAVTVLADGESGPGFLVADATRRYW